ncbi:pseudaminic acid cytidylyltransferase [Qipengyuania flava]|nr:pseudaminic acid cytidylyltransferase [Qipengyuania flava]
MRVAVIPARGGSKRIPRKNIRPFHSKPIIAWSIDAALESGCFSRVIVTTDDGEIADVAREHGAETPFVRPPELSDDLCGTVPVIAHAVQWLEAQGEALEEACCIYATAPFLKAEDLRRGLTALQATAADYAFSVTSYAFPIQRALRLEHDQRVTMFQPEHEQTRSQDLVEAWHDAGQFYWGRAASWKQNLPLFGTNSAPVILPRHRVQDIDTLEDWERAELMFEALSRSETGASV